MVFLGTFGSRFAQRIRIPQVVGCVLVGVVLGPDVFNFITSQTIEVIEPLTMFALGFIGFMIGGELRADVFKKYGKQFFIILVSQGVGAFLLVALATSVTVWLILPFVLDNIELVNRLHVSIAMGLVFGAIASATAPAATTNVLWEYKTRGPLTAAVLAIVALDDALALLLYRGAATAAQAIMGTSSSSFAGTAMILFLEIMGVVVLGFVAGLILYFLLKFIRSDEKILGFSIALLSLVAGITIFFGIEPILPSMIFGITIANLAKRRSKSVFELVKKFSPPVYTAFFVLAGAHIEFGSMSLYMAVLTVVYIVFRVFGKVIGTGLGAKYSKAPKVVQKYLGICLLPQAGVAIGLAIVSGQLFSSELAKVIIIVVMTGTFVIEIFGPILVKLGVKKAGEVGLNVTEEDLIKTYVISDVMDTKIPLISAGMCLSEVIQVVSQTSNFYYPVVDSDKQLIGAVTLDGIRNTFTTQELNDWLVALDIMEPIIFKQVPEVELSEAFEIAEKLDIEYVPVVASDKDETFVGILDFKAVHRSLTAEVLERQRRADSIQKSSS
ncbi:MAG: cation:proton antiporter domain-containing protein [Planctomycetota bacterium]